MYGGQSSKGFLVDHHKVIDVICLSGIACQVYDHGIVSTVHSFYGLSTVELPWQQFIDCSAENCVVRDQVKALDIIVWDKATVCRPRGCSNLSTSSNTNWRMMIVKSFHLQGNKWL